MAKQTVNLGVIPDGVGGDDVRTGFTKVNDNFTELYTLPSQAEAELGTDSVVRGWSALRVRQAIIGWWNSVTSSLGRNFIAASNEQAARNVLQLGTAATTNNGIGLGQNIINSAVSGTGNISYSETLLNNTTGYFNTAAGMSALQSNTTGYNNTAAGMSALQNNTTGHNNTAAGLNALQNNTIYNNCSGFGFNSQVTASNQIQLGNSAATVYAYGAVQNRSDARDKTEIRDTVLGLDFINALRPVDYKLDMREDYRIELGEDPTKEQLESNKLANIQTDGTHTRKRYHHGVIAQQVAEAMEALGVDFGGFQDHSKIGGDDVLSIGYEEFIAPLIKAVQELSARVKELEDKD